VVSREGAQLALQNLTLQTPGQTKKLLQGVTFSLPEGKSLLISGPSGVGLRMAFAARPCLYLRFVRAPR